jgi:hypothetical protein
MPPKETEIKNLKNFRGNILDRQFPVQFDPTTGMYSYDYVKVTPEIEAKLKALQYFRKSSKSLAEIEADLAAYLAKEGPAAPRAKGEITKAAEGQAEQFTKVQSTFGELEAKEAKEGLTPLEISLGKNLKKDALILLRPKKAEYAKQQQEKLYNDYNKKVLAGEAIQTDPATGRLLLSPTNKTTYDSFERVIKSFDTLQRFYDREKKGETLTPQEESQKQLSMSTIDKFKIPDEMVPKATNSTNLNEKGNYNNARAKLTQLQFIPNVNLTTNQKTEKTKALNIVTKYMTKHPEARVKQQEKLYGQALGLAEKKYRNAKRSLNNISKKNKPLSVANTAEQARLQGIVNTYKAAHPNANTENVSVGNFFNANRPAATPLKGGRRTRKVKRSRRKTTRRKY